MGLRITEDVLYYAENGVWKPLPVIKGKDGEDGQPGEQGASGADAYNVWLESEGLQPSDENFQKWLQLTNRVPVPGASRVVKEGTKYYAYTPKKVDPGAPEPPSTATMFVPWDPNDTNSYDKIELPVGGEGSTSSNINYKSVSGDTYYPITLTPTTSVNSGALVSEVGVLSNQHNLIYNPSVSALKIGQRDIASTANSGQIYMRAFPGTAKFGSGTTSDSQRDVFAIGIGHNGYGDLYIGGTGTSNNSINRTIIMAGQAAFRGNLYNYGTGTSATDIANTIYIQRKPSGITTTDTTLYKNIDSGHVEHIKVPFKITPARSFTQGRTYYPGTPSQVYNVKTIESLTSTWNYIASNNAGHSYDVIIQTNNKFNNPHIQYSVLGEEMAYLTPFADHFNIWGVRYDSSKGQLHFSISCKKSKSNFSNDYPKYDKYPVYVYIDFMLFTSDYK